MSFRTQLSTTSLILTAVVTAMVLSIYLLSQPTPSLAQDATESAQTDTETTSNLKERIERIVDEKKEQIKGVLSQIGQQQRGFIGEVMRISQETITIDTPEGLQIVPIDQSVALVKANDSIDLDEIEVGQWATVLGIVDEDDTFQARKVIISETSLRPRPQVVIIGTVSDTTQNTVTVIRRDTQEELSFDLSSGTVYQDSSGETVDRDTVTDDVQVLIVGVDDDGDKEAVVIRLLTTLDAQPTPAS